MVRMKEAASIWCTVSYYSSFYDNSVRSESFKSIDFEAYLWFGSVAAMQAERDATKTING